MVVSIPESYIDFVIKKGFAWLKWHWCLATTSCMMGCSPTRSRVSCLRSGIAEADPCSDWNTWTQFCSFCATLPFPWNAVFSTCTPFLFYYFVPHNMFITTIHSSIHEHLHHGSYWSLHLIVSLFSLCLHYDKGIYYRSTFLNIHLFVMDFSNCCGGPCFASALKRTLLVGHTRTTNHWPFQFRYCVRTSSILQSYCYDICCVWGLTSWSRLCGSSLCPHSCTANLSRTNMHPTNSAQIGAKKGEVK